MKFDVFLPLFQSLGANLTQIHYVYLMNFALISLSPSSSVLIIAWIIRQTLSIDFVQGWLE